MSRRARQRAEPFHPALKKKLVLRHSGFEVYAVDAFAIRNAAKVDEEFTNFATHDELEDLIPKGEIWISHRSLETEGIFFIADALVRMKALDDGMDEDKAQNAGVEVDRLLRKRLTGLEIGRWHTRRVRESIYDSPYITLADPKEDIDVWLIDGAAVRGLYKTDFTEGGHGYVYRWCPKNEIWIERDLDRREIPFILAHEYTELRLMRDEHLAYDEAHEICSRLEFKLRKGEGAAEILCAGRSKLGKRDVVRLTSPAYRRYVADNYLHNRAVRRGTGRAA